MREQMMDTANALTVSAGLVVGLVFNIIAFCVFAAPFLAIALALGAKAGPTVALTAVVKLNAALQLGYIGGLLARNLLPKSPASMASRARDQRDS